MNRPVPSSPSELLPFRTIPFLEPATDNQTVLLTDRQRAELVSIATRVRLPARMMIYHEDSSAHWVFVIAEGVVKSYRELPSGKRLVAAFLFPRDLFGLAEQGRYLNSTQAITRVTLYRLPVQSLAALLKHDGDLQFAFLAKVTHELREAQRRTILVNRRDAVGRLATFIALMGERTPHSGSRLRDVYMPMTRSDIAGFLGLSLESVSRAAAELERRGLVRFESRNRARILDASRLARIVAAV